MRAYGVLQSGAFVDAQARFEAALKARQAETRARKRLLPLSIAWLYPLALIAQQTPKHLELARKFCIGEAGTRSPSPHEGWGRWVHAIGGRLGDRAPGAMAFAKLPHRPEYQSIDTLWELLLAAWVGRDATAASGAQDVDAMTHAATLRTALDRVGFQWLVGQVDADRRSPAPGRGASGGS